MVSPSSPTVEGAPLVPGGVAVAWSDEALAAELRAHGLLVGDPDGPGPRGPRDGGGGGGDGDDDDEEWAPRHHSRAVKATALLAATFLILGTAGAWISVAIDASHPAYPVEVASVQPTTTTAGLPAELVEVRVDNATGTTGGASCAVEVDLSGHLTTATFGVRRLPPGAGALRSVTVPVARPAPGTFPAVAAGCAPS